MGKSSRNPAVFVCIFAITLILCISANTALAASIDTTPDWNGSFFISSFGYTNTATYGQTLVRPAAGDKLTDFTFNISVTSGSIDFRGYVYAWDEGNNRAVGPALYESATVTRTTGATYDPVVFTMPGDGLQFMPGQMYVLFVSHSRVAGNTDSGSRFAAIGDNASCVPGNFVFINNGIDDTQWTASPWTPIMNDLSFTANFTDLQPIPTVNEWGMILLISLLGISGVYYARKNTMAS
ncbi:MAG: hypothetical protein V1793_24660 [Pseudomonadota bacterium]